jgi:hypothetical protein
LKVGEALYRPDGENTWVEEYILIKEMENSVCFTSLSKLSRFPQPLIDWGVCMAALCPATEIELTNKQTRPVKLHEARPRTALPPRLFLVGEIDRSLSF